MKKHYTHFDTTQFAEVVEVQEQLLIAGETKKNPHRKRKLNRAGVVQ
ncbi:MAG: hypothetical protein LBF60_06035 [Treponema sp.]|jgi:hypothetical protein|nr:hypothetical protein [Treponema sp.]